MNKDEVIPPSPPVKFDRSKGRTKPRKSPRNKKRRHSILSLRAKNLENSNTNGNEAASNSSSGEISDKNTTSMSKDVNIYVGLDDSSVEEKNRTQSLLNNFDILGQSKLIENCNQFDLSQRQEKKIHRVTQFSQKCGLISLREFVSTRGVNFDGPTPSDVEPRLPDVQSCSVDEAKEISRENIQFSEWPLSNQFVKPVSCEIQESLQNQRDNSKCDSHLPAVVQSILNDFDDDIPCQESIVKSPPPILIRRCQRRTYQRAQTVQTRKLLIDDDENQRSRSEENEFDAERDICDIPDSQCNQDVDIDIDLNSSRRIVENLNSLSTFFTQPQSYELDFNTDLSHTIPDFEKRFDEFVPDSDDFEHVQKSLCTEVSSECVITSPIVKYPSNTELLNLDDDIFIDIDTPKGEQRSKNVKQNPLEISTPLSSAKAGVGDSGMRSTPSTSKLTISNEQRVPKRLHFGADFNQLEDNVGFSSANAFKAPSKLPGFAKAGGGSINMSSTLLERAAETFADIDNDYRHIDVNSDDTPNPKRIKHTEHDSITALNRKSESSRAVFDLDDAKHESPEEPSCTKFSGFRMVSGKSTKLPETATSRARNLFGEDFSDLKIKQPALEFNTPVAGPSNVNTIRNGFTTSRRTAIKISATNLQRYGQVLKDIDQSVCEEFGVHEEKSAFDENAKTPLAKKHHQMKFSATSTPNPNSVFGFKNVALPPITPINKTTSIGANIDHSSWANNHLNEGNDFEELFETSTQQLLTEGRGKNTSVNLNDTITSDFHPINDSIIENGFDVLNISDDVKCERRKALNEQQADCFKKSCPIRPLLGWLFIQKLLKSMKLHELGTPKMYRRDELERMVVLPNVIDLNINNALQFKFDMWNFYPLEVCRTNIDGIDMHDDIRLIMDDNSRVGLKEITSAFLQCPSVDPKLIPDHWIKNALKWIIVKLASYERSFPMEFSGKCLTPENVLAQLHYRYEREIDKVQRSAIRRIVEKDDTAAKRMVLFVSRILEHGLVHSLELSDGWYSIRTSSLDVVLSRAVTNGKIAVGTKLVIQGAELVGIEEGCSPLEMPSSVALKISGNSTRRARWHAKLGYCKESWPFAVALNSVHASGDVITRTKAFVLRVYPLVFAVKEKTADGQKTVFRSNKVEQRQGKKYDRQQFEIIEKLYSQANEQIEKEYEMHQKKYKSPRRKLCDMNDAEELWNFMENSNDGISIEVDLTSTQRKLLSDYQTKYYDEKQNKIAAIVKEKLNAIEKPAKSTALQKIRLIDATSPDPSKSAILSIWNVNESQVSIRENTTLDLRNITANGMRGRDIQLTASPFAILRETHSMASPIHEPFKRKLTSLADIEPQNFKPHFNEFDTMGIVLKIDDPIPNQFQCVFIADAMKNILCIKFWGSVEQCAYDDIVRERRFVVISHLEWRPFQRLNRNGVLQAFVTDVTSITESPKSIERSAALSELKEQFDHLDLDVYLDECLEKSVQNVQANKENSTSNITSKPNESTSNHSMLSRTAPASSATGRPILVQHKIERLQNYGSPPAFRSSYLHSNTHKQTSSRKPFKNPLRQESTDS